MESESNTINLQRFEQNQLVSLEPSFAGGSPPRASLTLEIRQPAGHAPGWTWPPSPAVGGEKPARASQGAEPIFVHGEEIKEFGQLFPAECQEHLRSYKIHCCPLCAKQCGEA